MNGLLRQEARQEAAADRTAGLESGLGIGVLASLFMGLPGLRGLWLPGASVAETGNVSDISGQGRTLTYNGNPTINLHNALVPYLDLDGTGDFLSRPDENGLDVAGTETYIASGLRGLTVGGWFWSNAGGAAQGLIGKRNAVVGGHSYLLETSASNALSLLVSTDGNTDVTVTGTVFPTAGWFFAVGRFTPSTELKIFMNGSTATNTTSIPASIFNGSSAFQIGSFNAGVNLLVGRCALGFLCAAAVPDSILATALAMSRGLFGV